MILACLLLRAGSLKHSDLLPSRVTTFSAGWVWSCSDASEWAGSRKRLQMGFLVFFSKSNSKVCQEPSCMMFCLVCMKLRLSMLIIGHMSKSVLILYKLARIFKEISEFVCATGMTWDRKKHLLLSASVLCVTTLEWWSATDSLY